MAQQPLTPEQHRETLDLVEQHPSISAAAKAAGMSRATFDARVREARKWRERTDGRIMPAIPDMTREQLVEQLTETKSLLKSVKANSIDDEYIKSKIIGLTQANLTPAAWLTKVGKSDGLKGVPTLFASDWHHGEVVHPLQINGVNEFNMAISARRARRLIDTTTRLCFEHFTNPVFDGIVFALGGDMVSGDIHDELEATNEQPMMPVVIDLVGVLMGCIERLADSFGRVFVPCVTGNHGRMTRKPRAKHRNFTNFDWLIYQILAKHFANDERVTFLIPDGTDAHWAVYSHRYAMTHGDQFRGGDGMIGMLGPVTRGDMKKRARNAQINLEYDTLLVAHWHQLHMGNRVITNGTLKGYDEWAASMNFPFEVPQQALWITHPKEHISFRMEVHLEDQTPAIDSRAWVAVAA